MPIFLPLAKQGIIIASESPALLSRRATKSVLVSDHDPLAALAVSSERDESPDFESRSPYFQPSEKALPQVPSLSEDLTGETSRETQSPSPDATGISHVEEVEKSSLDMSTLWAHTQSVAPSSYRLGRQPSRLSRASDASRADVWSGELTSPVVL